MTGYAVIAGDVDYNNTSCALLFSNQSCEALSPSDQRHGGPVHQFPRLRGRVCKFLFLLHQELCSRALRDTLHLCGRAHSVY